MAGAWCTERDMEGVAMAMAELLEEEFIRGRCASMLEAADEYSQQRLRSAMPRRTLAPGYYTLAIYMFWLEGRGKFVNLHALLGFEAEGLSRLARARQEFDEKHPPCTRCGARQDSGFVPQCYRCHATFRESR